MIFIPRPRDGLLAISQQDGKTYVDAGDERAEEQMFTTGDPAGFTIIDVLAWGSLGHALGYAALASSSAFATGISVVPTW